MTEPAPLGVYIHWPYCARICPYCDFNVYKDRGRSADGTALVDAIAADLTGHAARLATPVSLVSIYFGGGTPSLLPPEAVARLIAHARALWPGGSELEITLEANPADLDRLAALAQAGVNRLSLGVQSFDDDELRFLRRDHDAATARQAVERAVELFPRVSFDLIYALPGQTPQGWAARLEDAAALGAEHLSLYQLTLEPGTATTRAAARGLFAPVADEVAAAFDAAGEAALARRAYEPYEISNFARGASARSRHNLVYWRGEAYVGVGPGAHGRLPLPQGRTATEAERAVEAYVARVAREGVGWASRETLDAVAVAEERVYMGLRTLEGVGLDVVQDLGRGGALARLQADGWLEVEAGRVRASAAGRPLLDRLVGELLA